MSPYEIEILLHYYSRADDTPQMELNPPVWKPTRDAFLQHGFLEKTDNPGTVVYRLGDRGVCFVKAVLALRWPVWTMPRDCE